MLIFQAVQSFESNKKNFKKWEQMFFFLLLGHDGNKNQNKHELKMSMAGEKYDI